MGDFNVKDNFNQEEEEHNEDNTAVDDDDANGNEDTQVTYDKNPMMRKMMKWY